MTHKLKYQTCKRIMKNATQILFVFLIFSIVGFCAYEILHSPFSMLLWLFTLIMIFGLSFSILQIMKPRKISTSSLSSLTYAEYNLTSEILGIIKYSEDGFSYHINGEKTLHKWIDISQIEAYKTDEFVFDTICLEIQFNDGNIFSINEETPGWFQFNKKIKEQFSEIDKDWDIEIAVPAFETNLTILYSKDRIKV